MHSDAVETMPPSEVFDARYFGICSGRAFQVDLCRGPVGMGRGPVEQVSMPQSEWFEDRLVEIVRHRIARVIASMIAPSSR